MATYTPRWQTKSLLAGDRECPVAEAAVVRRRHIGKPRAKLVVVHADERVAIEQVDVVVDDHDVAAGEVRIQPAGGVRNDQELDAEGIHHANGKRRPLGRVAFVTMEAALHGDDRHAAELAAEQSAAMADGRRFQKVRDVAVVDRRVELDRFADRAQAGAENDAARGRSLQRERIVRGGFGGTCAAYGGVELRLGEGENGRGRSREEAGASNLPLSPSPHLPSCRRVVLQHAADHGSQLRAAELAVAMICSTFTGSAWSG